MILTNFLKLKLTDPALVTLLKLADSPRVARVG